MAKKIIPKRVKPVKLKMETIQALEKLREFKRETYNDLVWKLLQNAEKTGELSK